MRLFFAINIPDHMRNDIWESAAPLRDRGYAVRWVAPEAMHITLKFLGEVAPRSEETVIEALRIAASETHPFTLPLGGFGAFPNPRRAKVVWLGCKPPQTLRLLHQQIEERAKQIGFAKENRAYHPHLTLGRLHRGVDASRLRGLGGALDSLEYTGEVHVKSVELMQSELSPAGARYTARASAELSR